MLVSVVIPTLNEAATVEEAVASAFAAGADEVLVADGGSSDDTPSLAIAAGAQVIRSPAGRATQQNAAALTSRGDAVLFLHADCRLPVHGIQQVRAGLQSSPAAFGGFRQHIPAAGRLYRWLESGNAFRIRRWGLVYGDQGFFVRRKVFEQVGGFPDVPLMEDLRLSRTLRTSAKPLLLEGPLEVSPRRWQQRGVVRQTTRNWLLLAAHRVGVSPARLAGFYPHVRAKPTRSG